MRDPELPVRVDSVFALRSFVEACRGVYQRLFCFSVMFFLSFHYHLLIIGVCDRNLFICSICRFE